MPSSSGQPLAQRGLARRVVVDLARRDETVGLGIGLKGLIAASLPGKQPPEREVEGGRGHVHRPVCRFAERPPDRGDLALGRIGPGEVLRLGEMGIAVMRVGGERLVDAAARCLALASHLPHAGHRDIERRPVGHQLHGRGEGLERAFGIAGPVAGDGQLGEVGKLAALACQEFVMGERLVVPTQAGEEFGQALMDHRIVGRQLQRPPIGIERGAILAGLCQAGGMIDEARQERGRELHHLAVGRHRRGRVPARLVHGGDGEVDFGVLRLDRQDPLAQIERIGGAALITQAVRHVEGGAHLRKLHRRRRLRPRRRGRPGSGAPYLAADRHGIA